MPLDKQKVDKARKLYETSGKGVLWSPRNIVLAVLAVVYALSPLDVVPEWLFPIVGWLDDAGVLAAVICWILSHRSKSKESHPS